MRRKRWQGRTIEMAIRSASTGAGRVQEILRALAEPQRVAILKLVHGQELPAGEIAEHFKTTRQTTSQHLRLLTGAGLLELRREGTKRLYRVNTEAFGELRTFVDIFWSDSLSSLKRRVENDKRPRRER
jgi:DNA-binding transcriptional ArsR family regulator